MVKILANDGIAPEGKQMLEDAGFQVDTEKIEQDQLKDNLGDYSAIIVRSASKVTKDIIDANPQLKVIGRAGVGLDNIDVEHAQNQGRKVINTPAASSLSVAELAFGHLAGLVRFINQANREMPEKGKDDFKSLKKNYAKGIELRDKTIGIIGAGRIGQEMAKIALGAGMHVKIADPMIDEVNLELDHIKAEPTPSIKLKSVSNEELLKASDFVSLHVPATGKAIIGEQEINMMKDGAILINCARGGVVDEDALLKALDSGKISCAGLDVFDNEPTPNEQLLTHDQVSLTPHIGASSNEAQKRVGIEMAEKMLESLKELA